MQGSRDEAYVAEQHRLKTKAEIEKLREELTKIEHRAKGIKELIRSKINECEGFIDSAMNVDELENENANKMMNIIMDGRAACIPRDDVIYMSDILDSLANRESSQSFDGKYRLANFGEKEYLLPPRVKACSAQT